MLGRHVPAGRSTASLDEPPRAPDRDPRRLMPFATPVPAWRGVPGPDAAERDRLAREFEQASARVEASRARLREAEAVMAERRRAAREGD